MAPNEPDNSPNPIVLDLCRLIGAMMVYIEEKVPDPTLADILTQLEIATSLDREVEAPGGSAM